MTLIVGTIHACDYTVNRVRILIMKLNCNPAGYNSNLMLPVCVQLGRAFLNHGSISVSSLHIAPAGASNSVKRYKIQFKSHVLKGRLLVQIVLFEFWPNLAPPASPECPKPSNSGAICRLVSHMAVIAVKSLIIKCQSNTQDNYRVCAS